MSGRSSETLIVAHRGFSARFPENSREAFEAAIACGADFIETDVRQSNDGTLFCNHDPHLERTRGTDKTIAGLPDDALDALEVMRLADVLALARGRVRVLVDLKLVYADYPLVVLEEVVRQRMADDVAFGVRNVAQAAGLRGKAPSQMIVGLLKTPTDIPAFYAAGGTIARLWEEEVDEASVAHAAQGGHPVWVTTGLRPAGEAPGQIDAPRLARLRRMGIAGVLVNDPEAAVAVLRASGSDAG